MGEKIINSIVTKSKKDSKRFNLMYGTGKNATQIKLEAGSEKERDLWVLAIQLMIVYHLRMGFLQEKYSKISSTLIEIPF